MTYLETYGENYLYIYYQNNVQIVFRKLVINTAQIFGKSIQNPPCKTPN